MSCLLALAAIQVPWIVCTGCCEDVSAPALGVHECHVHEKPDPRHDHPHDDGCTCGHGEDETTGCHGPTGHLLVQLPAVNAGTQVVLPARVPADLAAAASYDLLTSAAGAAQNARHPPDAALTGPRGASERLLL